MISILTCNESIIRFSCVIFYWMTVVGCDKFRESRNWDSRSTNGLRIRIPGDRKPRIKFLWDISGYFRLLRNFRKNDLWWPLVITRGILLEFQNITSGLEIHELSNGGNFSFRFENLVTSGQWILLIISGRGEICRQIFDMFLGIL